MSYDVVTTRRRRAAIAALSSVTYAAYVASLAPLLWRKFNEASGTTVINYGSLGSGNATWTPGVGAVGQTGQLGTQHAYLYDALDSITTGPTSTSINNATAITHAVLLKIATAGEANLGYITTDNGQNRSFSIASGVTPFRLSWAVWCTSGFAQVITSAGQGIDANTWTWLFTTFDNADGVRKCHIYKGLSSAVAELTYATDTAAPGALSNASGALEIGNRAAADRALDGYIDEHLFWNRALTPAEMTQITLLTGV